VGEKKREREKKVKEEKRDVRKLEIQERNEGRRETTI